MKNNTDLFLSKAMDTLQNIADPAPEIKEAVIQKVLSQSRKEAIGGRLNSFVTVYPWRFALVVAVIQSVVCTLVFGSDYTNLILQFVGR